MIKFSSNFLFLSLFIFFIEANSSDSPSGPCLNNGTPLNSTYCLCPGFVDGQFCENVKCQRFSILDKNRCSCAPGWYDKYCAIRGCRPANEDNLDLSKRSFIIVFNTKSTMAKQFNVLKSRFTQLISSITKDIRTGASDNWIANYIFHGFVQQGSNLTVQKINTENSDEFLNFLNTVQLTDGDAQQPVLTALSTVQQTYPNMKSHGIVLVFTDSPASEATSWSHRFTDKNMEQTCLQISLLWRSKVSFFLSLPASNKIQPLDSVDVYRRLSLTIHGDTFYTNNEIDTNEILLNVISTYYYPENLSIGYGVSGNQNVTAVRDNSNDVVFVLITFGSSSNFSSDSTTIPKLGNGQLYSQGSSYRLYKYSAGSSTINIISSSNGEYNYRVFIQSKNTIHMDYNDDMVTDVGNGMAFIGVGKFVTMKLFGFDTSAMLNTSYRVLSSDNQVIRENFYASLRPQLDCTHEYSFQLWDTTNCPPGPIYQQHTIYYNGFIKQRVTTGYCVLSDHNNDKLTKIEKTEEAAVQVENQCEGTNLDAINDPRLEGPKQFIFILEQHPSNKAVYQTLANEIGDIIEFTKVNNNYDTNSYRNEYTLMIHCNKDSRVLLATYNPDIFVQKFKKLVNTINYVNNLDNTMGLLSIVQAQKMNIRPTSQVYYFTNQAVKNVQNISRTWDIVDRNIEFNFFTIADGVTTEIFALPWQLELVQKMSNGRIIPLGNDETSIKNIFGDISGMNALTTDNEKYDCHTEPYEVDAFVENGAIATNIQIVGTGIKDVSILDHAGLSFGITNYVTFMNPNFATLMIKDFKNPLSLTPGTWRVRVSTLRGGCQVTVRQQSKISVLVGFTSNITHGFVDSQIPSQRSDQNQSIFVPIHIYQPSGSPQVVPTAMIIENVNRKRYDMPTLFLVTGISKKVENTCSYAYSTPSIPMPQSELSFWTVTGTSNGDTAFVRRFYYYQHFPRDASVCHGGKVDQYGQCVCPPNYTGEYCWERVCVAGATFSYGMCCCPSGYYGDFCEIELFMNNTDSTTTTITSTIEPTTRFSAYHNSILSVFISITSFIALKSF